MAVTVTLVTPNQSTMSYLYKSSAIILQANVTVGLENISSVDYYYTDSSGDNLLGTANFNGVTGFYELTVYGATLPVGPLPIKVIVTYIDTNSITQTVSDSSTMLSVMYNNSVKIIRFRLVGADSVPLAWADIRAELVPRGTATSANRGNLSTIFPTVKETRTNEYGMVDLSLYANDFIDITSKYQVEITYNGKSYYFLIQLTQAMPDIIDFETLIDRSALQKLANCRNPSEGVYKLTGSKLWI